jgi:stage V sporulation protein B
MFSIVLSRKLGAEGVGLYSLIMPVYDLFCCLICGGMIAAISKEASIYYSKNDYANLNKSIHIAFIFDLIWAILIALLAFAFSPLISTYIIKDSRSLYSLWIICPALVFVALSSIIKGYFYGISNIKVPAIIDIFEKTVRMGVLLSLIVLLSLENVTHAVTATYFALSIGELISFMLLFLFYRFNKIKISTSFNKTESSAQLLFNILAVSFPLCVNGFLTQAISTASTLIIPRRLVHAGIEYNQALGLIGRFSGMALTIVFFPMIVVMSISIILLPDLSKSISQNDFYAMEKRIKEVLKISFLLGASTLVICLCIPTELGELFFSRNDLGPYIKMAALCAPFSYLAATTFGILNGIGKQKILLKNSIITSIEQLVLSYILIGIPQINISGYAIAFVITSITGFILNIYEIRKSCYIDVSIGELIIDITLSILLYYVLKIFNNVIPNSLSTFKYVILIILGFSLFFFSLAIINNAEEG